MLDGGFPATSQAVPASFVQNTVTREHCERLDKVLQEHGFRRVPVLGDGDCLFSSVSYIISHKLLYDKFSDGYKTFLRDHDVLLEGSLALQLRRVAVRELVDNYLEYKDFTTGLSPVEYRTKVSELANAGTYAGDMGDFLIAGLSTALRVTFNVISSHGEVPFHEILPRSGQYLQMEPLTLAYTACGPGHYDATKPFTEANTQSGGG